ncbi:MAG: glycosyltransferase family 4 protein [Bacteroidales bacterium]
MKNILVNLYKTNNLYTGLGQFSLNFANELCRQIPDDMSVDFLIPTNSKLSFNQPNVKTVKANLLIKYFSCLNKTYDLWHNLYQSDNFLPNAKTLHLMTIHDLNFLIEKTPKKGKRYLNRLQQTVNRTDYITSISDFAKSDIERHIALSNKTVRRIYNGISFDDDLESVKPDNVDVNKFFFTISHLTGKKNIHTLLPMLGKMPDYKLVIAGNNNTSYADLIRERTKTLNIDNQIVMTGAISSENKKWLYENCEAFLFPSIAEGFGMPAIEAMYYGKPVFLSNLTSLPEVGGDFAYYFQNFEAEHMLEVVKNGLRHYEQNEKELSVKIKEHAESFSWERCIKQYLELYREILF